jgi:hypothetical protein
MQQANWTATNQANPATFRGRGGDDSSCEMPDAAVLVCDLAALSPDEQRQRAALADEITAAFREVRETEDGYAARIDDDPALCRRALEWLLLERRCCPFLDLRLALTREGGPLWLHFGGGPGVKEFLAAAGLAPQACTC